MIAISTGRPAAGAPPNGLLLLLLLSWLLLPALAADNVLARLLGGFRRVVSSTVRTQAAAADTRVYTRALRGRLPPPAPGSSGAAWPIFHSRRSRCYEVAKALSELLGLGAARWPRAGQWR